MFGIPPVIHCVNAKKHKTMSDLIKFEQRAQLQRDVIGTVAEIAGKGTGIEFIPDNWNNPERNLFVLLKRQDGTSSGISCSPKVSKGVRNLEISMSQLAGFLICKAVSKDGEEFAQIQMPTGAGTTKAGVIDEVEEYKAETLTFDDLVKF